MDFSWVIPYTSGLLKLESVCLNYVSKRKDYRQWLGTIDALVALAYLRFRPGSKIRVNGLNISNDHSHQIQIRDWQLDLQSVKRALRGGSSLDLLNFKTPIYHSYQILKLLEKEEAKTLLTLATESVNFLLEDTYSYDLSAQDCLRALKLVLNRLLSACDSGNLATFADHELAELLCLKLEYNEHPLTKENLRLWQENLTLLKEICFQLKQAHERYLHGGAYEDNLIQVKDSLKRVKTQMSLYISNLEHI